MRIMRSHMHSGARSATPDQLSRWRVPCRMHALRAHAHFHAGARAWKGPYTFLSGDVPSPLPPSSSPAQGYFPLPQQHTKTCVSNLPPSEIRGDFRDPSPLSKWSFFTAGAQPVRNPCEIRAQVRGQIRGEIRREIRSDIRSVFLPGLQCPDALFGRLSREGGGGIGCECLGFANWEGRSVVEGLAATRSTPLAPSRC